MIIGFVISNPSGWAFPPYIVYLDWSKCKINPVECCASSLGCDRYRNRLKLAEQFELDHISGITCWIMSRTICCAIVPDKGNEQIYFFLEEVFGAVLFLCIPLSILCQNLIVPAGPLYSTVSLPWQTLFLIGRNCKGETWQSQRMFPAISQLCISLHFCGRWSPFR